MLERELASAYADRAETLIADRTCGCAGVVMMVLHGEVNC